MTISKETYAIFSGRAYESTRNKKNRFPGLEDLGWESIRNQVKPSGFEVISFHRQLPSANQIVIAYAGTGPNVLNPDTGRLAADWVSNLNLATGNGDPQLWEAADYYLQIRQAFPDATISFTGHSLGGGLAALMGSFFDKTAVTFDQAPFGESFGDSMQAVLVNKLLERGYSNSELHALAPELFSFNVTAREARVTNTNVTGEALSILPPVIPFFPPIFLHRTGAETFLEHGGSNLSAVELHSLTLLTTFLLNDAFREVSIQLPEALDLAFDSQLYARASNNAIGERNFLDNLLRHQIGVSGSIPADAMLDRFTRDLQTLANLQSTTPGAEKTILNKALIAFAIQKYYLESPPVSAQAGTLFTPVTGGVQFDFGDIAASLDVSLGYQQYFADYLSRIRAPSEPALQPLLTGITDWAIQVGDGALFKTPTSQASFLLAGEGASTLIGSPEGDVIIAGDGNDTLNGKAGKDHLEGGQGNDTLNGGKGQDTLIGGPGIDVLFGGDDNDTFLISGDPAAEPGTSAPRNDSYNGGEGQDTILGGDGDDTLRLRFFDHQNTVEIINGGGGSNRLLGTEQADRIDLSGTRLLNLESVDLGAGDDQITLSGTPFEPADGSYHGTIDGGADDDSYFILSQGGGEIHLHDTQGKNSLFIDGQLIGALRSDGDGPTGTTWTSANGTVTATRNAPLTLTTASGADIIIEDWTDGQFGITLKDQPDLPEPIDPNGDSLGAADPNPTNTLNGDRLPIDQNLSEDGIQVGTDALGNLIVGGQPDPDRQDNLQGSSGDDRILAGGGNDTISTERGGNNHIDAGAGEDRVNGGSSDDLLAGTGSTDGLAGGGGNDLLVAGAGDDSLFGDGDVLANSINWTADVSSTDWFFSDVQGNVNPADAGDDTLYAGVGDDWLRGDGGNDILFGGSGRDILFGDNDTQRIELFFDRQFDSNAETAVDGSLLDIGLGQVINVIPSTRALAERKIKMDFLQAGKLLPVTELAAFKPNATSAGAHHSMAAVH